MPDHSGTDHEPAKTPDSDTPSASSPSMDASTEASEQKQIYRRAGIISIFTLISRVLGAVRDLVIAHVFGAGIVTDAFIQAFTIPNILRRLTAEGSMTLAFIPIYTEARAKEGAARAKEFARKTLGLVLASTVILTALGMIFSPQMVYLVAAGYHDDPEKFQLTADLTQLMFPYLICVSLVAWAMGVLNAEKRFAAPAAAPIFLNIGIIGAAVLLSPQFDEPIVAIGWGVLVGGLLQIILQIPSLRKVGQSLKPSLSFNDVYIHKLLRMLGPSIFGVAVYQINIIILRNIASFLPSGQVTYYYNASRLTELVIGLFAFAFSTASFPDLSEHAARDNWEQSRKTLSFTLASTLFIVIPATFGLFLAAESIVSMLYLHGAFTLIDVQRTIPTLQAFALGIPAIACIRILVAMFYALKDTKTPVLISAASLLITGTLGWWLSLTWEVVGLALGLSVGTWFQFLVLAFFLTRRAQVLKGWWAWKSFLTYLAAAAVMGLFVWWCQSWGNWQAGPAALWNWAIFISVIAGAGAIYFSLVLLVRDSQAQRWLHLILRK